MQTCGRLCCVGVSACAREGFLKEVDSSLDGAVVLKVYRCTTPSGRERFLCA